MLVVPTTVCPVQEKESTARKRQAKKDIDWFFSSRTQYPGPLVDMLSLSTLYEVLLI